MNYGASKNLSAFRFKRLVGVERGTFEKMLSILSQAYQEKHSKGGRKPKLSLEDLLIVTLQYLREYRTYEQIAADFGIHESNLIRRSHWVEEVLIQNGCHVSKTKIEPTDTILLDATEIKINRPKKNQGLNYSGKKKCHVLKAQMIVTKEGRILSVDTALTYCHDMTLFRQSRRVLMEAEKILADSGYQGLNKIFHQSEIPIKSSKHRPLTEADKAYNRELSSKRVKVENIFAKVKVFKMFSTTYRNRKRRFNLRMNLIAGILNVELRF